MNFLETKLVDAYAVLIMAGKRDREDAPEHLREAIEVRIAERILAIREEEANKGEEQAQ